RIDDYPATRSSASLLSCPSKDFFADAFEGNAFTGIELGGGFVEPREQSLLFRFGHDRFLLRLEPSSKRRLLVGWKFLNRLLDFGDRAHVDLAICSIKTS